MQDIGAALGLTLSSLAAGFEHYGLLMDKAWPLYYYWSCTFKVHAAALLHFAHCCCHDDHRRGLYLLLHNTRNSLSAHFQIGDFAKKTEHFASSSSSGSKTTATPFFNWMLSYSRRKYSVEWENSSARAQHTTYMCIGSIEGDDGNPEILGGPAGAVGGK
jgi:hypothetical protein